MTNKKYLGEILTEQDLVLAWKRMSSKIGSGFALGFSIINCTFAVAFGKWVA